MNKIIKKEYILKQFKIDSENIDKFKIMENRRQIGSIQVTQIHGALLRNENPIGTLIVNEKNDVWRLIDGNHRLEALKRFYGFRKENKKISVECTIHIYKDLTDDEEREVYSNEARRKNESHEDRLNLYRDNIIFWKLTQDSLNKFPCKVTIYNQKNSLRFRTILDSLCTIKTEMPNGYNPNYLGKERLIEFAKDLGYDDFVLMKKFLTMFVEVFGEINKDNILTRRAGFLPLFDIFVKNLKFKSDEEIKKRFKLIIGKSDILMYLNMQGREAQQKIRELMVGYMNKGKMYSKNRII